MGAAVELTPAADRPYIGGSGDNSALGLAFGYNGLSRLTGESGRRAGGGGGFDGATGIGRMFNSLNGGQIAWLLPTALLGLVALFVLSRRAGLTDRTRAAAILWGGWLIVTAAVLSFAGGIIHTYYTVELAPAIAVLVAVATVLLWRNRTTQGARVVLATGSVLTGLWTYALLHRTPSFHPWVGYLVVVASVVAGALAVVRPGVLGRWLTTGVIVAGLVTMAGGSAAYALDTAATAQTGSTPSAGPAVSGSRAGGPGGERGGFRGGPPNGATPPNRATPPNGATTPNGTGRPIGGPGGGGGGGGATVSAAITKMLKATTTKWAAAAVGSQSAGPLELATGQAVMAIGGFSGSDPAPTLAQFQKYVADGQVGYFIVGGTGGGARGGNSGSAAAITAWVAAHFTADTVGGTTVYDLTAAG